MKRSCAFNAMTVVLEAGLADISNLCLKLRESFTCGKHFFARTRRVSVHVNIVSASNAFANEAFSGYVC